MAVQAQHPSNAFYPDFRSCSREPTGCVLEDIQAMQGREHQIGHLLPSVGKAALVGAAGLLAAGLPNASVFSDHQQSELTCNVSGSRKRSRDEQLTLAAPAGVLPPLLRVPNPSLLAASNASKTGLGGVITSSLPVPREQRLRVFDSAAVSTSGRPSDVSVHSAPAPLGQEILAQICHHNFEMDALIRLQNESIRLGMEEARKRHCKSLLSILEQRVVKRLREKEIELEDAIRKNAELDEKIRQMSVENQIWFNLAKNNEVLVFNLKTSLEQVLLQTAATAAVVPPLREGYGDSDGTPFPADDAESFCFEDQARMVVSPTGMACPESEVIRQQQMACKVCGVNDVCVLVLPCRHLCLCKDCETRVVMCPICNNPKNASLRVFMS